MTLEEQLCAHGIERGKAGRRQDAYVSRPSVFPPRPPNRTCPLPGIRVSTCHGEALTGISRSILELTQNACIAVASTARSSE